MSDVVELFRVRTCRCGRKTTAPTAVCRRCEPRPAARPGKKDPHMLAAIARGTIEQHFTEWA